MRVTHDAPANLSFSLPWVRQGAAARSPPPTRSARTCAAPSISPRLTVNGTPGVRCRCVCAGRRTSSASIRTQVVRTDPRPGTATSSRTASRRSNSIAPIFPGCSRRPRQRRRAAAAVAVPGGRAQAGRRDLTQPADSPLPALEIAAPREAASTSCRISTTSWAWAHAQVAADARNAERADGRAAHGRAARVAVAAGLPAHACSRTPTTSPAWCRRSSSDARPASVLRSRMPS